MGCWVVPAVAAELWGVPLERIMDCIRNGTLFWKRDAGFVLIDADPAGASTVRQSPARGPRPPTYTVVITDAEKRALLGEDPPAPAGADRPTAAAVAAVAVDMEEEADSGAFDWRTIRNQVSASRRAPVH